MQEPRPSFLTGQLRSELVFSQSALFEQIDLAPLNESLISRANACGSALGQAIRDIARKYGLVYAVFMAILNL